MEASTIQLNSETQVPETTRIEIDCGEFTVNADNDKFGRVQITLDLPLGGLKFSRRIFSQVYTLLCSWETARVRRSGWYDLMHT